MGCKSSTERPTKRAVTFRRRQPDAEPHSFLIGSPRGPPTHPTAAVQPSQHAQSNPYHHRYLIDDGYGGGGGVSGYRGPRHDPWSPDGRSFDGNFSSSAEGAGTEMDARYDYETSDYDGFPYAYAESGSYQTADDLHEGRNDVEVGRRLSPPSATAIEPDQEGDVQYEEYSPLDINQQSGDGGFGEEFHGEAVASDSISSSNLSEVVITLENPFHPGFEQGDAFTQPVPFSLVFNQLEQYDVVPMRQQHLLAVRNAFGIQPVPPPTYCRRCPLCSSCIVHVPICPVDGAPHPQSKVFDRRCGGSTATTALSSGGDSPLEDQCTLEFGLGLFDRYFLRMCEQHHTCLEHQNSISLQTLDAVLGMLGLRLSESMALLIVRRLYFAVQFLRWAAIDLDVDGLSASNIMLSVSPHVPSLSAPASEESSNLSSSTLGTSSRSLQVFIAAMTPDPNRSVQRSSSPSVGGRGRGADVAALLVNGSTTAAFTGQSDPPVASDSPYAVDPPVVGFPLCGVFPELKPLLTGASGRPCPLTESMLFKAEFWKETAHVQGIQELSGRELEQSLCNLVGIVARLNHPAKCLASAPLSTAS